MDAARKGRIEQILGGAQAAGRRQLLESEVYRILNEVGISTPRFEILTAGDSEEAWRTTAARLAADASMSGEVVIKIQSPDILHKTEAGGIAFTRNDPDEIVRHAKGMIAKVGEKVQTARIEGVMVCEKVAYSAGIPGAELLLSLRQDPALGPVVVLGIGGLLTEWYGKLAPRRTAWIVSAHDPIFEDEAPPRFKSFWPAFALIFRASRLHSVPPVDPDMFWGVMRSWADLAVTFGIDGGDSSYVLDEIEINPIAAIPGSRPIALDGVGCFSTERPKVRRRRIEKIDNLLRPRSAAVIGASGKAMNPGRIILQNLRSSDGVAYGHLYPVHPKEEAIDTIPCVKRPRDLPERVDLAVVSVPAEGARDTIRELVESRKAHSIILIPGGFAETGNKHLAEEIIQAIEDSRSDPDGGLVLVGGNCLGIVSKDQYNTFFLPEYKLPFHQARGGNLAAISQSGAYLVTLTSNLDGVIYPKASISYGNQMDLTVSDFLEYYLEDPEVQVIACYVEGFQPLDGMRFVEIAREHRKRGRTVIAFKAGKTDLGARAAASHTASLAGNYDVARSLMVNAGAIVAESLNQFEDYTKVFTMLYDRVPKGCRVAVISNAGFECSAAMDALYDLELATLSDETRTKLAECLPGIAHADNPVDATPMAGTGQFVRAFAILLEDPEVDVVVVSPVPDTQALDTLRPDLTGTHLENIYAMDSLPAMLTNVFRHSDKPIVASVDSGRLYDEFVVLIERAGIPTYRKIDRATRAMSLYCSGRASCG